VKAKYIESHKLFCKLSLNIHYIYIFNPNLFHGELKFEIWALILLFSLNQRLNGGKNKFKIHKKNWLSKSFRKAFFNINASTTYYH
jgi:hypothetical protein